MILAGFWIVLGFAVWTLAIFGDAPAGIPQSLALMIGALAYSVGVLYWRVYELGKSA